VAGRGFILTVYIVDAGDRSIKVGHEFYGFSVREVETYKREHLASCEYFRAAEQEGRTLEEIEEVDADELPDADEFEEEELDAG
jgi:hypothetical protein